MPNSDPAAASSPWRLLRHGRRAFQGSAAIAASQAITLGLGAIAALLLARVLGPDGRGGLSLLQAISALVATVCLFGTPTLIIRRHLLGPARSVVVPAVALAGVTSVLVAVMIGVLYLNISPDTLRQGGVTQAALIAAALNSAALVIREGFAAHLQSSMRFHRLAGWRIAWASLPLAAILLMVPWDAGTSVIFIGIAMVNVIATLAIAPTVTPHVRRVFGWLRDLRAAPRRFVADSRSLGAIALDQRGVRAALGSHVALTMLLLVYRLDVLLLGVLSSAAAVGLYSIAYMLAELPWLLANGYAVTLLPRLAADPGNSVAAYRRGLAYSMVAATLVVACLVAVGQPLIDLLLGPAFDDSYTAFLLLAPGVLAFVPFKLVATRLIAAGAPWRLAAVCVGLVLVNVGLNLLLDPRFGASGCAVAATVTYLLAALSYVPLHRHATTIETHA